MEFIDALFKHSFIQNAVIAGILSGVACGITGTFVVIKRISFISGGIAHTALGGIGAAFYFGINPIIGALTASIIAAVIIGFVTIKLHEQSDTLIGALWAIGMATGVLFISITPGYNSNLLTYLFGNILMVSKSDLIILLLLDITVILLVLVFYRQFVSISFDEEYSKLRGLNVNLLYILLLCIIAITIVVMIQIVGLILVIALLTIPAAISKIFMKNISRMMALSVTLSLLFSLSGIVISYNMNSPAGATIIIISGVIYFLSLITKRFI